MIPILPENIKFQQDVALPQYSLALQQFWMRSCQVPWIGRGVLAPLSTPSPDLTPFDFIMEIY